MCKGITVCSNGTNIFLSSSGRASVVQLVRQMVERMDGWMVGSMVGWMVCVRKNLGGLVNFKIVRCFEITILL